jgi:hypothetical protein
MRKVIVFLLVLVAFKTSQAQQINTSINKPVLIIPDTSIVVNSYPINNRLKSTTENMPNPHKGMGNQLTNIGSKSKGFDMYQSKPDNMIVLKPDSINLALTYIPNLYGFAGKKFILSPKTNLLIATILEIKITTCEATPPIIK